MPEDMRRLLLFLTLSGLLILPTPGAHSTTPPGCDALCARSRTELRVFTDWLARNGAKGYVGEIGIPGNGSSAASWSTLAQHWYTDADAAQLWVTTWATGEWWSSGYMLTTYGRTGAEGTVLNTPTAQSAVIEAHPSTTAMLRGVNIPAGPSLAGGVADLNPVGFSNKTLWKSPDRHLQPESLRYLAGRGVKLVRLPFNWERLQPTLKAPLADGEVAHLRSIIDLAATLGITVALDMHNFGGYYAYDASVNTGRRQAIGSAGLPISTFADSWARIAAAFGSAPNVVWDIMNEPARLPSVGTRTPALVWEQASQAAVTAIRNTGDRHEITVPGYGYSPAASWNTIHPKAWITDPVAKIRYQAHQYWDTSLTGEYKRTYADELVSAQNAGYTPMATATVPSTSGDTTPPVVSIQSPSAGTIAGKVTIVGTVQDASPGQYYLVVTRNGATVAGPGMVTQWASITAQSLYTWNTASMANGSYIIKLEARDVYGNKGPGSAASVAVQVLNG